jgi:hypothetical protein
MPRARTAQKPAATEEVPQPILVGPSDVPKDEKSVYWLNLIQDLTAFRDAVKTEPFFDLLPQLPEALWEKHLMGYLYRLDPAVRNAKGQDSYIGRFTFPIDEEYVKEKHGGGKYLIYLKCGKESIKEKIFSIDGPPKFIQGQTLVDSTGQPISATPAPTPTATNGRSEVAQVLEAASAASKVQAEIMSSGMESALALQTKLTERSLGLNEPQQSTTESKIMDRVLDRAFTPPQMDPMVLELFRAGIEALKAKNNPEPVLAREDSSVNTIESLKDLFGVENIGELGKRLWGKAPEIESPWLAEVAKSVLTQLPSILDRWAAIQQQNFERMLIMSGRAQPGAGPARTLAATNVQPPQPPSRFAPYGQPTATSPINTSQEVPRNGHDSQIADIQSMVPVLIEKICNGFDRQFEGALVAASLDLDYPTMLPTLAGLLTNPEALKQFIQTVPQLAERSKDPEWPIFQEEFLGYVTDQYAPEQATPMNGAAATVPATGAA